MIFVYDEAKVENGTFTHYLSKPCNCFIGLVEFHLPSINDHESKENFIDITCDQINSTYENPKRLLRRICFERLSNRETYNNWEAIHIDFKRVDSDENFLHFRINRTLNKTPIEFNRSINDRRVFYTLAIKPIGANDDERWACI